MTRFVALFVVLALSLGGLTAQKQYSFLQVNNANGLVSNRVSCVFKDSRGFIWIGTKAGLSRFDGPNVVNYKHDSTNPSSILDNYIINIQEDKNGNLLLQTSIGYIIFDIHKEKFYADINKYLGLKSGLYYFQHIYCDPNKELWVKLADQQYYLRLNADKQVLEHRFQKLRPEGPHVLYFKHVANAYYYLFDNGRIECYNDTNYELKFANNFLLGKVEGGSFTPGLLVDRDSDIWFYGNNNGVYHFSAAKQRWQHYGVHEGSIRLSSNIIYEIIQDNKGLIWVATDHGGINIINKTTGQIHKLNHSVGDGKSLADNSITDLYMDDNQIIWASTNKSGVSYYHESIHKFPHYSNLASENSGMSFSDVNCFAEDALGNLWIGTNGAGLVYFNRKTNTYTYHKHRKDDPQSISSNVVVSLFIDSGGELWIGTYAGGVNRFNGTVFKA